MNILDINDPSEAKELLRRTGLDIVLAGRTGDSFEAAHGTTHSVLVLNVRGERYVWKLDGGHKDERRRRTQPVREMLVEKFNATIQ